MDLYRATEYLTKASVVLKKREQAKKQWTNNVWHDPKHKKTALDLLSGN